MASGSASGPTLPRLRPPPPARFLAPVASRAESYPYPAEQCGLCEFLRGCQVEWEADDHLTLVADIRRAQVERLTAAGIATMTALGDAAADTRVRKMRPTTFANLRHQAELQLRRRAGIDRQLVKPWADRSTTPEGDTPDECSLAITASSFRPRT